MNRKLTKKEEDVLAFIYGYFSDNDFSPTRQEVGEHFNISRQGADFFIYSLIKKGKLLIDKKKEWRNILIASWQVIYLWYNRNIHWKFIYHW